MKEDWNKVGRLILLGLGFVTACVWMRGVALACDVWPNLEIQNKGTADETWNVTMNFTGSQCETKKDTKLEYTYYKYEDQSLEKKTLYNIDTGTALPVMKPGDKLRYKACFTVPKTNILQNPICPTDSDTSYYLGCSLLNTQAGKDISELIDVTNSGSSSTVCREEYFEANFYSNAPLEATVDCSSGRAKVHLFSTYADDGLHTYCPGRNYATSGSYYVISTGFKKGSGQKYSGKYCQFRINDYFCATPYYDKSIADNEYTSGYGSNSAEKIVTTDYDVLNHQFYHYRFDYQCSSSNDVTVYVNCGDPKKVGGGTGEIDPDDPVDPENINDPGPCDPINPNCDYANPELPSDNDFKRPCKEDYPNGTKCGGGIKIGSMIVSINNPYNQWSDAVGFQELTTQDWYNGYENTKTLVYNSLPNNPAASYCWNKSDYDYIDWYLPALGEMEQIRTVLSDLWNNNQTDRHLSNFIHRSFGFPVNPPTDYDSGLPDWDVMRAWTSNERGPAMYSGVSVYKCDRPNWDAFNCPVCSGDDLGFCFRSGIYTFGNDHAIDYFYWPRNCGCLVGTPDNEQDNFVYRHEIYSTEKTEERMTICVRPVSE